MIFSRESRSPEGLPQGTRGSRDKHSILHVAKHGWEMAAPQRLAGPSGYDIPLSRTSKLALAVVLAIVAGFAALKLRYAGKAPVSLPAENCDAALWKHVYEKERLHVITECTVVEGRVVSLRRSPDGDLHIALDPANKSVLNLINLIHAHGTLVVEAICDHEPTDDAARTACKDFHPQLLPPNPGDRVRVTGAYVNDTDNGWNELHPVSRIEVLR